MVVRFIKLMIRNIRKYFFNSLTNIFSIAVGITAVVLVAFWIMQELSYDKFNEKKDRIYRITSQGKLFDKEIEDAQSGKVLSSTLPDVFHEVENATALFNFGKAMMSKTDGEAIRMKVAGTTSSFFEIFSLPVIRGDYQLLEQPNTAFITESAAKKIFGDIDPVGEILTTGMDHENKKFSIVGVMKDIPENSHFQFDFLFSLQSVSFYRNLENDWMNSNFYTYILLNQDTDYKNLETKVNEYAKQYFASILKNWRNLTINEWEAKGEGWEYVLQPLTKIHLYSSLKNEYSTNGDITYVWMGIAVGLFILIISTVNFVNLTTVRSINRMKEISVKKVNGASNGAIRKQFIAESCVYSFLALLLSVLFVSILIPVFESLTGISIYMNLQSMLKVWLWAIPLSLVLGLLAGMYPAFFASRLSPLKALASKSKLKLGDKMYFKDILLVGQFAISILVIICTISVTRQLNFLQNEKLGFKKENVIVVKQLTEMSRSQQKVFKEKVVADSQVKSASFSHRIPGSELGSRAYTLKNDETLKSCFFDVCPCDASFFNTYNFELLEGDFFTDEIEGNSHSIVLNEKAVVEYNIENPVGKRLYYTDSDYYEITGIVKNFHYDSKRNEIQPAAFVQEPDVRFFWAPEYLSVSITGENNAETLKRIKNYYNEILPGKEFVYCFFDSDYDALYKNEYQTRQLFTIFSVLAICLSCIGLFILVHNIVLNRIKEIGVRKVNGANSLNILVMISGSYLKWVIIAFIIACPTAYYAMNKWLENFAYKTNLSWWIFALAGLIALFIALLTVSWQSWQAANRNPVEALRYE